MVEYLIQVSVMSVTCTIKVSVIQRVHRVLLGFPFNAVLKQIPPTFPTGFLHVKSTIFPSPVARIVDMNKHITDAIMALQTEMLFRTWQELKY
jgi:hypothetical protein